MRTGITKDFRGGTLPPLELALKGEAGCFLFLVIPSCLSAACAGSTNLALAYPRRKLGSRKTLGARSVAKEPKVRQKRTRSVLIWYVFVVLQ